MSLNMEWRAKTTDPWQAGPVPSGVMVFVRGRAKQAEPPDGRGIVSVVAGRFDLLSVPTPRDLAEAERARLAEALKRLADDIARRSEERDRRVQTRDAGLRYMY